MATITVHRTIQAPANLVFRTVAHIQEFSNAVDDIIAVEFLSDRTEGVGTRFRETRRMGGREATTELEVTEYEEGDRIRLVSEAGGTVWDSLFTVAVGEGGTELTLVMEARPQTLRARISGPLMRGFIRTALEKDMDAVKEFCERE